MKELIKNYSLKIQNSFQTAWAGKEDLEIVLWIWGGAAYLASIFINKLILWNKIAFFDFFLSAMVVSYFVVHIIITRRCAPKKTPLTKEQKEELKKDRAKKFLRKLFLQEPLKKWNPVVITIAIDLYIILYFSEYIIKLL